MKDKRRHCLGIPQGPYRSLDLRKRHIFLNTCPIEKTKNLLASTQRKENLLNGCLYHLKPRLGDNGLTKVKKLLRASLCLRQGNVQQLRLGQG
jgi:hypothetical protein